MSDERTFSKAGILAGAERWGQVLRDFLNSGEELEELDPADFGAHGESQIQGLADALGFSALAVGLGEEVLVDIFEGSVMLVRRDAIERHRPDGVPANDDGYDYDGAVALALHRGFRRLGLEFEPGELDPEAVRRGLERAIAALGAGDRLSVEMESPTCVALRLKGGHIEPLTPPRSLGLAAWKRHVDEFILSEDLPRQHLIKPGKVELDEALEKTITTVRAMELDDFLVVDTVGGNVRLRYGRDVGAEDLEDWSARAPAVERLPFEPEGSLYYEWLLERVILRGFSTLTFDLAADENPEVVKRGLELAAVRRGERDRIAVKVAGPAQVSVRLKGGHKLPRVVPKRLGLARWANAVDEFIFEDDPLDEHRISPADVSLEEALEKTITVVRAMELDDFLTVDELDGFVRVRRTADVPLDANPSDSPAPPAPGTAFDAVRLLELFLESGDEMVDVDWRLTGRRWDAVVQSLRMAVLRGGLQDGILVRAGRDRESIALVRRDLENPTG
jgi:hypothetical protein